MSLSQNLFHHLMMLATPAPTLPLVNAPTKLYKLRDDSFTSSVALFRSETRSDAKRKRTEDGKFEQETKWVSWAQLVEEYNAKLAAENM